MTTLAQHFGQQLLNGQLTIERAECNEHEVHATPTGRLVSTSTADSWKEFVPGDQIIIHCRTTDERKASPATDQAGPIGATDTSPELSRLLAERHATRKLLFDFHADVRTLRQTSDRELIDQLNEQIIIHQRDLAAIQGEIDAIQTKWFA